MVSYRRLGAVAFIVAAGLAVAFSVEPVAAQGLYTPPAGSPFSPYLELYRPNPGLLNQYYQFMVPRIQLRTTLTQQQASLNAIQSQIQNVRGQLAPQRTAVIGPTGVGAGYMNYSHFYPGSPVAGGAR